jgi:hypothetical protein
LFHWYRRRLNPSVSVYRLRGTYNFDVLFETFLRDASRHRSEFFLSELQPRNECVEDQLLALMTWTDACKNGTLQQQQLLLLPCCFWPRYAHEFTSKNRHTQKMALHVGLEKKEEEEEKKVISDCLAWEREREVGRVSTFDSVCGFFIFVICASIWRWGGGPQTRDRNLDGRRNDDNKFRRKRKRKKEIRKWKIGEGNETTIATRLRS